MSFLSVRPARALLPACIVALAMLGACDEGEDPVSSQMAAKVAGLTISVSDSLPAVASDVTLSARLIDDSGAPVPVAGVLISWGHDGAGSLSEPSTETDATGTATVRYTTAVRSGVQHRFTASAMSGRHRAFGASARTGPGAAAGLMVTNLPASRLEVGAAVSGLVVQLVDAHGNPVADEGTMIRLGVAGGTHLLNGTVQAETDADGYARFDGISIVGLIGEASLEFEAEGLHPVAATFTVDPGAAASIVVESGSGQYSAAGSRLPDPAVIRVLDAGGNGVAGVLLSFRVVSGGGVALSDTVRTDAEGRALVAWELGAKHGTQVLEISADGLSVPAMLEADARAASLAFVKQPGLMQAGQANQSAVVVEIRDADGKLMTGASSMVRFAIVDGTGHAYGRLGGRTETRAVQGVAVFDGFNIDRAANDYRLRASSTGIESATSETFSVRGRETFRVVVTDGGNQSAQAGETLEKPIRVRAKDDLANGVAGVTIHFDVTAGGGSVSSGAVTTDDEGYASAEWTVGTVAGENTLEIWSDDTEKEDVRATGRPGPAAAFGLSSEPDGGVAGELLGPALSVVAYDVHGNVATSFTGDVSVSIVPCTGAGGATLSGTTTREADAGIVAFDDLSITAAASGYELKATSGDLTPATSGAFTISPADPATLTQADGDGQFGVAGLPVYEELVVRVQDAYGNNVPDATVWWNVTSGGGSVEAPSSLADASGYARIKWTFGNTAGEQTVQAAMAGLDLVEFTGLAAQFIDISGTGTLLPLACDDCGTGAIGLGFSFQYWGQSFSDAYVSSNGFLMMGSNTGIGTYSNSSIPNGAVPNGMIAPFWDDLHPGMSGNVYSRVDGAAGSRRFIVMWKDVSFFGEAGTRMNLEAILYEGSNVIEFLYGDGESPTPGRETGSSATIGVESPNGSSGVQTVLNQAGAVFPGRAFRFTWDGSTYTVLR